MDASDLRRRGGTSSRDTLNLELGYHVNAELQFCNKSPVSLEVTFKCNNMPRRCICMLLRGAKKYFTSTQNPKFELLYAILADQKIKHMGEGCSKGTSIVMQGHKSDAKRKRESREREREYEVGKLIKKRTNDRKRSIDKCPRLALS